MRFIADRSGADASRIKTLAEDVMLNGGSGGGFASYPSSAWVRGVRAIEIGIEIAIEFLAECFDFDTDSDTEFGLSRLVGLRQSLARLRSTGQTPITHNSLCHDRWAF
jgi:hypothetical protein